MSGLRSLGGAMRRREFIVMAGSAKGPNNCGGRGRTRGLADANDPFAQTIVAKKQN